MEHLLTLFVNAAFFERAAPTRGPILTLPAAFRAATAEAAYQATVTERACRFQPAAAVNEGGPSKKFPRASWSTNWIDVLTAATGYFSSTQSGGSDGEKGAEVELPDDAPSATRGTGLGPAGSVQEAYPVSAGRASL
jgi:hypothetical protein